MEILAFLTSLAIVLIVGLLLSILSKKINLPDTLLLILGGMALSFVYYNGSPILSFPIMFLIGISFIALLMIVFDSASRLKLVEVNNFSDEVFKLALLFLLFNLVFLTFITHKMFSIQNVYLSLIFSVLMAGTAPDVILPQLRGLRYNAVEILKLESIVNTPLTVLLPFILIDLMRSNLDVVSRFMQAFGPLLQQFITGIGAGVIIGFLIFKIMGESYSTIYSPLGLIIAALLAYLLAENLGGNGVLAVAIFGLVFANSAIKNKFTLLHFESELAVFMNILVFTLIGLYIAPPLSAAFFLKALVLFAAYLLIRFASVAVVFRKSGYDLKEQVFMTLATPKGISVAVVAFTLMNFNNPSGEAFIPGIAPILSLTLVFMLYSIITSSITAKFAKSFLKPPKKSKESVLSKTLENLASKIPEKKKVSGKTLSGKK